MGNLSSIFCGVKTRGRILKTASTIQQHSCVGNHPCLDLINTQMIVRGDPTDLLGGCEDLVVWLVQVHMVDKPHAVAVLKQWGHKDQEQLFEQGVSFRRTLRDMVSRIVARKSIPDSAIASINQSVHALGPTAVRQRGGYTRQFQSQAHRGGLSPLSPRRERFALFRTCLWSRKRKAAGILYCSVRQKSHPQLVSINVVQSEKSGAHYQRKRIFNSVNRKLGARTGNIRPQAGDFS